jgi:Contractile injection system tube protein/LysM domain
MEPLKQAMMVVTWFDGTIEFFAVQFNPTELSFNKGVQVAEIPIPGLDTPLLQFVRGQNETVNVDLFFDSTDQGMGAGATSVTKQTDQFYQLVKIEPDSHAPPICTLTWNDSFPGADISKEMGNQKRNAFQCIVESVRHKYTLFSPEGVPLRATLSLTLREYKTLEEQLTQLNLNSPDRTQGHVLEAGETLSSVAGRHYRRPGEWRVIADANGIEDPRRLAPGIFLTVPPMR